MARHRLVLEPTPDIHVIGISSHMSDHRLCWTLNLHMGLSMGRRANDIVVEDGDQTLSFPAYDHLDLEDGAVLSLVWNQHAGRTLIREQPRTDCFMVMDVDGPWRPSELIDQLRGCAQVLAAFPLDVLAMRDGHKLIIPDADRPKDQNSCHHRPGQRQT